MKYGIRYVPEKGLLVVDTHGIASVDGLKEMLSSVLARREWVPGMKVLVDHRDLEFDQVTIEDVRAFQEFTKEQKSRIGCSRMAALMPDTLGKGISLMWSHPLAGEVCFTHRVFVSEEEATTWLEHPGN